MINGISGKPGGGKSYEAVVNHIIPVITKDKRKVVTNLPLNVDHFCNVFGDYCRDLIEVVDGQFHNYGGERPFSKKDHYVQYEEWQNEKGQKTYFFIDECHLAMGQGSTEKELKEFYSMHRHYGFDIMLITQNFRKVDRDIRDMVQTGYRAIKKSMMGQDDKYILKVHDGASASNSSVVATHERIYEKKYFSFYQSHTKSEQSVQESESKDIAIWYKHWTIKASAAFFFFGFIIIANKVSDMGKDEKTSAPEELPVVHGEPNQIVEQLPRDSQRTESIQQEKPKSIRELEYEEMVAKSKTYHPFYKVSLSITGYSIDGPIGQQIKKMYLSANQNGQKVFEISDIDLMKAGYDVTVYGSCSMKIRYYDYEDFLTCDAPTQEVTLSGQNIASN